MVTGEELRMADRQTRHNFSVEVREALRESRKSAYQISREAEITLYTMKKILTPTGCPNITFFTMSKVARILNIDIMFFRG